jgi:hypothetical protein
MLDFPGIGASGQMFGNRLATVGYGGALFRQLIHITKNKNLLPAETQNGGCEYRQRNLTNMAIYR